MRTLLAGIVVTALFAVASPAHAAPQSFYFNCIGPSPVQTINATAYSWSATPPAKSYQEGAGCGWIDVGLFQGAVQPNPIYDAGYGGEYGGEVRKAEITLYAPYVPGLSAKAIDLIVRADGEDVVTAETLEPSKVEVSSTGLTAAFTYTARMDVPGLANGTRGWELAVSHSYLNDNGWLHGAKEVPSNIRFFAFEDLSEQEQQAILDAEAPPADA